MEVTISDDFRERGVDVTLGVLQFRVPSIGEGALFDHLNDLAERLAPEFEAMKPADIPQVTATRKAYRALGKDPGRYRPSSEALMRRIASGKPLPLINDVVDCGNVISLTTRLSIGAYDAQAIEGAVIFRRADDGEMASAIGRGEMNFEHLPVFADARGPFGSPTSDTQRTMVKPGTRSILMVLIAFDTHIDMEAEVEVALDLVRTCCGAEHALGFATSNRPEGDQ